MTRLAMYFRVGRDSFGASSPAAVVSAMGSSWMRVGSWTAVILPWEGPGRVVHIPWIRGARSADPT